VASLPKQSTEVGDELVAQLKRWWSGVQHRPTRGHVTLKGHASHAKGMAALLCVSQGRLSVVGGDKLDQTLLKAVPCSHVLVEPQSDCTNFGFYITTRLNLDRDNGGAIFISLPTRSLRDTWLAALSAMHVQVKGWNTGVGVPLPHHPLALYRARALKPERPFANTGAQPLLRWLS